jgi:2-keto-3-deoxy-6-phosphogluconate aldolase
MNAGCVAVAAGSGLISSKLIRDNELDEIQTNARMWVAEMQRIQNEKKP